MSPVFSQSPVPLKAHYHRSQVYWTLTTGIASSVGDSKWAIHRRPERTSQTSTELLHLEALDQEARHARLVTGYYVRRGGSRSLPLDWGAQFPKNFSDMRMPANDMKTAIIPVMNM